MVEAQRVFLVKTNFLIIELERGTGTKGDRTKLKRKCFQLSPDVHELPRNTSSRARVETNNIIKQLKPEESLNKTLDVVFVFLHFIFSSCKQFERDGKFPLRGFFLFLCG